MCDHFLESKMTCQINNNNRWESLFLFKKGSLKCSIHTVTTLLHTLLYRYEYDSVGNLATRGHWAEVNIIRQGMPQSRIVELLPITSSAVLSIMDASTMIHGGSKVSIIDGGSLVRPHTGATNSRLRVHMGLMVPPDCGIVVNGEERTWAEGKCMVFDDSFVHSVWQNSSLVRIILIVDIWHPRLNETGRLATMNEEQRKWYHGIKSMMADGVWMEAAGKIQQMIKT